MDVICIGHAAFDLSLVLDAYPAEDSKHEVDRWLESGGGPAANAAYLLGKWGAKVCFCGRVGCDQYADRIGAEFDEVGVDRTQLEFSDQATTPVSTIVVNRQNGSRTIINRGANIAGCAFERTAESPKVLLFDGHQLGASLAALEDYPDAISILDAGSVREGTIELAKRVDFLIASRRFAQQWFNDSELSDEATACSRLAAMNPGVTAITLGERGCVYTDGEAVQQLPAEKVVAVDTTAAGDIFHGAFAFACTRKMSVRQSLVFATRAAGLSVTRLGGRQSIPELKEVESGGDTPRGDENDERIQ
jgi:sugar/nucleoside kinase (ribokinase family)